MALQTNVNSSPATGSVCIYDLKTVLKAAGWTVPLSSDGTTYNASGDQITTGSSGAGGMANNRAWFVIREPGGLREWCYQRISANTSWRVKYSRAARFTGGSPGATQTPSATDEQVLLGGGTDAVPTGSTVFTTDAGYKAHHVASDTAVNGAYYFASFTTVTPAGTRSSMIGQDPILVGSGPALDGDPVVTLTRVHGGGESFKGYMYYGTASESFVTLTQGNPGPFPAGHVLDPNNQDVSVRQMWWTSSYWKGMGAFVRCRGYNRSYPDTVNLATDAYVYWDDFLLPWQTGTAPQL